MLLYSPQFKREWFSQGRLPSLPGGPEVPLEQKKAILQTHKLADVLYKLNKMAHATKIKLEAVR